MIATLTIFAVWATAGALAVPVPQRRATPLRAYAHGVRVVVDHGTWNGAGDPTIPGWTPYAGAREIHLRPEVARAWRNHCGRRARALAHFIVGHETGHAVGIASEEGANAYAYQRVEPRYVRLLPAYGALLSTWRALRERCL